jgi:diaminopimelate decarboxylase
MVEAPNKDSRVRLSEAQANELATRFGTPLYVIDEQHFRERIRRYRAAFEAASPGAEISYASKANSTLALVKIAYQEGCSIDVASEGELRAALLAGAPASACHLHGNNKQLAELQFALDQGIGQIMVDNHEEIATLARLGAKAALILRLAPGVDPHTHAKISTGQADTKFGFNIGDGAAEKAVKACLDAGLHLTGFHCHVGSQLLDPGAQRSGGEALGGFAVEMKQKYGFEAKLLNVGGGLGVRYTATDDPMPVEDYCRLVCEAVRESLAGSGLNPKLAQEPGRSLVCESGVTLYRVGVLKEVPTKEGRRTYVSVDGGLSDNPRPVMYESKYTVERVGRHSTDKPVTISGKHCETDKLFPDMMMPADLKPGDLIQVLCTGAYNSAMASNYNRYPRPATALIRSDGRLELVQTRETWEQMFERESIPSDLKS